MTRKRETGRFDFSTLFFLLILASPVRLTAGGVADDPARYAREYLDEVNSLFETLEQYRNPAQPSPNTTAPVRESRPVPRDEPGGGVNNTQVVCPDGGAVDASIFGQPCAPWGTDF